MGRILRQLFVEQIQGGEKRLLLDLLLTTPEARVWQGKRGVYFNNPRVTQHIRLYKVAPYENTTLQDSRTTLAVVLSSGNAGESSLDSAEAHTKSCLAPCGHARRSCLYELPPGWYTSEMGTVPSLWPPSSLASHGYLNASLDVYYPRTSFRSA